VTVIIWCQWRASETDAADRMPVRNRGAGRVRRAWLHSAASVVTGLPSRLARVVAVLRREHTRDTVRRWLHATTDALSGIPPSDVSPRVLEDPASSEDPSTSSRHAA
jgi:hypothetical protein